MLLIWQKFGFLIPVIGIGALLLAQLITNAVFGPNTYENNPGPYAGAAMLIAAALTYGLHLLLAPRETPRALVDPQTNQKVTLKRRSTFFFVPIVYWSYVFAIIGIVFLVASLFHK